MSTLLGMTIRTGARGDALYNLYLRWWLELSFGAIVSDLSFGFALELERFLVRRDRNFESSTTSHLRKESRGEKFSADHLGEIVGGITTYQKRKQKKKLGSE